ncbi:hypothetical protein AVEN_12481-1 [Araneus ventricosus]|uniref:Uncharacterized protein n=1 Tax=Araneus ventricosus TaxID=182803 RepID=A0A4Y2VHD7_ARAVE|nr:hypothetical protein AVEN_173273-1 [Araneus ventricosus]GBO23866.1 hypothetical protein AVEN_12481-1 [Araneus ventricosus]
MRRPRLSGGKVSASGRRTRGFRPDSTDICCICGSWCTPNLMSWPESPPAGVVRKFGERAPAQVSSSSYDCGSKLRGASQNSPRVASNRDVFPSQNMSGFQKN